MIEEINTVIKEEGNNIGFHFPRKLRVGARNINVKPKTMLSKVYNNADTVTERYRHRYSFNLNYKQLYEESGLVFSSFNNDDGECTQETLELPNHRFFVGVQYHPELISTPFNPHPLITEFLKAAIAK